MMKTGVGFIENPEDEIFNVARDAMAEVATTQSYSEYTDTMHTLGRTMFVGYDREELAIQKRVSEKDGQQQSEVYDLIRRRSSADNWVVLATINQDRELAWATTGGRINPLVDDVRRTLELFSYIKDQTE